MSDFKAKMHTKIDFSWDIFRLAQKATAELSFNKSYSSSAYTRLQFINFLWLFPIVW